MITIHSHCGLQLLRKPSDIASIPGKEQSMFDVLQKKNAEELLQKSYDVRVKYRSAFGVNLEEQISLYGNVGNFQLLTFNFSLLCNRLDVPTSGYLLFANSETEKEQYETHQKQEYYQKYYLARVVGDIRYRLNKNPYGNITYPIMHHQTLSDRMTCVIGSKGRGRSQLHKVTTGVEFLHYDEVSNTSVVKVMITKGIRHQIRVHLSNIGHPIVGDAIYGAKGKKEGELWLTSVGIIYSNNPNTSSSTPSL